MEEVESRGCLVEQARQESADRQACLYFVYYFKVVFCFVSFFGREDFRYLRLPLYVSNF